MPDIRHETVEEFLARNGQVTKCQPFTEDDAAQRPANGESPHFTGTWKIQNGFRGRKHTPEAKAKIAEARHRHNPMKGKQHSPETKQKITEALKRYWQKQNDGKPPKVKTQNPRGPISEETRRKMSEAAKRRRHSEETRRKISEAQRTRRPATEETRQKLSDASRRWHRVNTVSAEARRKISKGRKGKRHSEEARKKMSESHKGLRPSEETRRKMSESQRRRGPRGPLSEETRRKVSEAQRERYRRIRSQSVPPSVEDSAS